MKIPEVTEIGTNVWRIADSCNVYLLKSGEDAFCFDFGSGGWLDQLPALGIRNLTHVFLTHHHTDQCAGLEERTDWPFVIYAPKGDEKFLDPQGIRAREAQERDMSYYPVPESYCPPGRGISNIRYELAGNVERIVHGNCVRFVSTPGHGENAVTAVVEFEGRQWAFCGDAAYAGATIWQPYNLEWDHWTGKGALSAWEGIVRLRGVGLDVLCPSHGPMIGEGIKETLETLDGRLMDFYRAKGSVCAGEKDRIFVPEKVTDKVARISAHLYAGPGNGYLLLSESGTCLVVDPTEEDAGAFREFVEGSGRIFRPEVGLVSHAHVDHYAGLPGLHDEYGLEICLHPRVAEGLRDERYRRAIYRTKEPLPCDRLLPEKGVWNWREYAFEVAAWPGQTWWHAAHQAQIDGRKVFFGGDSFQPSTRWNGTGGFCALNMSRFGDGFESSAQLAMDWQPELMANGHKNIYYFTASRFRRIKKWSKFAERATLALCPHGSLGRDYYIVLEKQGKPYG